MTDPEVCDVNAILLASEERDIPREAVDLAVRMAKRCDAPVHVFTIARVWGTSFGFPNPGLMPSKAEWDKQHEIVRKTVARLRRKGIEADGRVIGTRAGAKRIVREARRLGCDTIIMGADPPRGRIRRDFMWSQEPYRVRRRAGDLNVYLIVDGAPLESAA